MNRQEQIQKAAKSYANKSIRDKGIAYLEFIEAVEWGDATLIEKVCNWLKSKISIDWNKLKKAIITAIYIFIGLSIALACAIGVNYIALTHPVIATVVVLVILFCLLVAVCYK